MMHTLCWSVPCTSPSKISILTSQIVVLGSVSSLSFNWTIKFIVATLNMIFNVTNSNCLAQY